MYYCVPHNPSSWTELHLPVCHALLLRSRCYLCSLVMRFAELALSEASKITGILVSIKCARTTQVHTTLNSIQHCTIIRDKQGCPTLFVSVSLQTC